MVELAPVGHHGDHRIETWTIPATASVVMEDGLCVFLFFPFLLHSFESSSLDLISKGETKLISLMKSNDGDLI